MMPSRPVSRRQARLIDRLLRKLGWVGAAPQRPVLEALEPRTLMSIAAVGSPIKVDSGASQLNINPQIATAANGNFVVVWATASSGNVAWRLFDSTGTPLTDEAITGNTLSATLPGGRANGSLASVEPEHPQQFDVAMDSAGDFVIVWQAQDDIYAQRYDTEGTPLGASINVTNTAADVTETSPAVAMDPAGDFAVTWLADTTVDVNVKTMTPKMYHDYVDQETKSVKRSTTPLATGNASSSYVTSVVQARRITAQGSSGALIQVSLVAADAPAGTVSSGFTTALNPDIAMDSAGDFAVAWDAVGYAPQKTTGAPLSKSSHTEYIYDNNNASKKITLHYYTGATFNYNMGESGVKATVQRYNAAGTAQGAAVAALSKTPSVAAGQIIGTDVKVSMDSAGDFAVTGAFQYSKVTIVTDPQSHDSGNYYATSALISVKRYSKTGAAVGAEATVVTAALTPFFSSAPLDISSAPLTNLATAMDSSGNLLVMWDQFSYDSGSTSMVSSGLFGRRYNAAGAAQETTAFQVPLGAGAGLGAAGGPFVPAVAFSGGVIDLGFQLQGDTTTDVFAAAFRPVLPASKLVFTHEPDNGLAGTLDEIHVTVEDANGFVVTDGSSVVKLAVFSGPSGAALSGTTSVTTVNGIVAFAAASLSRGGTYVLKATDGALAGATSSSFQIMTVPTQLAFTTQPANGTAGHTLSTIVVSVRDANGDLSVSNSSTITLSVASGPNALAGTFAAAAVNGVATFSDLSLTATGTYTLLASDAGLASATSSKFTITAGAAANFAFSTEPTGTTAGAKFTVRVAATDAEGNPALLDHSKVALGLAGDGPVGTLTGGTTVSLTGGVATFTNLAVPTAGSFTLTASSGNVAAATSSGFIITPAAASKLVFAQQPIDNMAGEAIDPAVEVDLVDPFGNVITTNNSAMTLTVASSPKAAAAITGTLVQNASSGAATFSNLALTTAGAYTLKVTQGKFSVTSSKFIIFPDVPAQLVILAQPKSNAVGAVAGLAIKPAITAAIEDQFGNIETSNSSVVTMTINSGPIASALFGNATASAVKGIATFNNLILHTAGSYTLAATQGSLGHGVTNQFLISPAAGATLHFVQPPSDVVAGQTMSTPTTVQLMDAFGNIAAGDHSTVTLKIANGPPGGKLFGKFTAAAVNGLATFNALTLQTAGSYTLAASDGKLVGDTSSSFLVTAAIAAKMVFATVPSSAEAGIPFAVEVDLLDAFGNVATGDSSNVTLSLGIKPAGGTLAGTATASANQGIVDFAGMTLSTKGSYTLKATDANPLAVITSQMINVLLPPA